MSDNYNCWGPPTFDSSTNPWTSLGSGHLGSNFKNADCTGNIVTFTANKLHECIGTSMLDSCSGSSAVYSAYDDLSYCASPVSHHNSITNACGLYERGQKMECF